MNKQIKPVDLLSGNCWRLRAEYNTYVDRSAKNGDQGKRQSERAPWKPLLSHVESDNALDSNG